jgi:hypothetical protein
VRIRLLKNERAGLILEQLRELLEGGLEVHTQIVLCPEWNDGDAPGPDPRRPLGAGRGHPLAFGRAGGAHQVQPEPTGATPDRGRSGARRWPRWSGPAPGPAEERGFGWAYAADEMYLNAWLEVPDAGYYDDGSLMENGVGSVRRFIDDLDAAIEGLASLPAWGPVAGSAS